jgi:RimJ/RimL family protein N-acetyltransferase
MIIGQQLGCMRQCLLNVPGDDRHHDAVLRPKTITTARLVLTPLKGAVARAVVDGDLSRIARAAGWPHDDTLDAIQMATAIGGSSLVWLVTLDGLMIGECGTVGGLDETGAIEIGYGLAAEHRERGYRTEFVIALSDRLLTHADVEEVVAREVLVRTSRPVASWRTRASLSSANTTG